MNLSEHVAVKIIDKGLQGSQATLDMLTQEVAVMDLLHHPNVLRYIPILPLFELTKKWWNRKKDGYESRIIPRNYLLRLRIRFWKWVQGGA